MAFKQNLLAGVSCAALIVSSTPGLSQSILDGMVDREIVNGVSQRYMSAYQAIVALAGAQSQLRRIIEISRLRQDYKDTTVRSAQRFLSIEDFLMRRNGSPQGFLLENGAETYDARLHGRDNYGIRLRACGVGDVNAATQLPERGYRYATLTILPQLPVTHDNIRQMVLEAGVGNNRINGVSLSVSGTSAVLGIFNGLSGAAAEFTSINGDVVPLNDCLVDASEWSSDVTSLGPHLAMFQMVYPNELQFTHVDGLRVDELFELCRDYSADLTIGRALFTRDAVTVKLRDVTDPRGENNFAINEGWLSRWTYAGGCQAPRETSGVINQACTRTIAGTALDAQRIWKVRMREVAPESGFYLDGEQPQWSPIEGTWSLFLSHCDGETGAVPAVIETATNSWQTQNNQACPANYPVGSWDSRRKVTDTNYQVEASDVDYDVRTYGGWETTRNSCSVTTAAAAQELQTLGGCLTQSRTATTTTTLYQTGAAPLVTVAYTPWYSETNVCFTGGGSSGSSGNSSEYYDVDGDGKSDFASRSSIEEYARQNGGRVTGNFYVDASGKSTQIRSSETGCFGPCGQPSGLKTSAGSGNQSGSSGGSSSNSFGAAVSNVFSSIGSAISSFFTGSSGSSGSSSSGSSSSGGSSSSSSRVICTELWRQGLVSRELAVMDLRFTQERLTPAHYRGYHYWAIPMVHRMRRSTAWTQVWKVLAVARMHEIAFQMGKAERPNYLGKVVRHTLEPISWVIGQFVGEADVAALNTGDKAHG